MKISWEPTSTERMALFEHYDETGLLLSVSSIYPEPVEPRDVVVRRLWSTSADPTIRIRGSWVPLDDNLTGSNEQCRASR